MRPSTAAHPAVGVSSNALAGARRFFAAPSRCMFGGPICGIETGRMTGHRTDGEYAIWGQTRCLCRRTKRQQAAALQALRACQRSRHLQQRVRNRWDQRRDRMGPLCGQARCLCRRTKRRQAAALQTLRAYQRSLHPRQRVGNHWDQRHDRMGRNGDRHVIGSEGHNSSLGAGGKRWGTTIRTRKLSVFSVNAEVWQRWVALRIGRCGAHGR